MSTKRSNKTARVLNLIATPNEAPPAEQPAPQAAPAENPTEQAEAHKTKPHSNASKTKKASKTAAQAPSSDADAPAPAASTLVSDSTVPASKQAQPQATAIPTPQPVVPIVQTVREKEQQLSDDIKSGLLQALTESESPAPVSSVPDGPQVPADGPDMLEQEPESVDVGVEEPQAVDTPPENTPLPTEGTTADTAANATPQSPRSPKGAVPTVPNPEPHPEIYTPVGEHDVAYTNVIQELVEETSPYYIANMLQCHCQRCIADMKALALTNLPAKYVVLENSKRAAYMSVYAARYEKLLSVQMMRACVIINEHPHH